MTLNDLFKVISDKEEFLIFLNNMYKITGKKCDVKKYESGLLEKTVSSITGGKDKQLIIFLV